MSKANDNNKVNDGNKREEEEYEFKYNLINIPWDDRTKKSKISIVVILVTIFVTMMACITHLLIIHYRGYSDPMATAKLTSELNCHIVKMEEYPYIARIHSIGSQDLVCVGAVVGPTSVLVNEVCIKSGPVRMRLGHIADPRCRKGFTVDFIEYLPHDSNGEEHSIVILTSHEIILDCAKTIHIGRTLDKQSAAYVIGRPYFSIKSLSYRPVTIVEKDLCMKSARRSMKKLNFICVNDVHRCPIRAGDLLIQDGFIFGVASRSSLQNTDEKKFVFFIDFGTVFDELMELIAYVEEFENKKINATRLEQV